MAGPCWDHDPDRMRTGAWYRRARYLLSGGGRHTLSPMSPRFRPRRYYSQVAGAAGDGFRLPVRGQPVLPGRNGGHRPRDGRHGRLHRTSGVAAALRHRGTSCAASLRIRRPQEQGDGVRLVVVRRAKPRAHIAAVMAALSALPLPVAKRLMVPTGTPS
jgi:hypothetical protein